MVWHAQQMSHALQVLYRGLDGEEQVLNFMGYVFQYKDPAIVMGLLRNWPHGEKVVFSPQLTFVWDKTTKKNLMAFKY